MTLVTLFTQSSDELLCTDVYYKEDYERILIDDWFVKRFLIASRRKKEEAFEMIKKSLAWRKEVDLRSLLDYSFPIEFYKIGGLFIYEKDKQDNTVIYMRIFLHQKIPELDPFVKKFLIHTINKADIISKGNVALVFDLTNAGYANVDLEFLKYLIFINSNYFPFVVKYVLVHNTPWFLNTLRKLIFSILPEGWIELIKFSSGDQILDYIDACNLPDYLGGTCTRNFRAVPKASQPVLMMAPIFGYSKDDYDRLLPHFEKHLKEAELLCKNNRYVDPVDFFDEVPVEEINLVTNTSQQQVAAPCLQNDSLLNLESSKIIVPTEIVFYFDSNENMFIGDIVIQNNNPIPIAYKVQSNNPKGYLVTQRLGIILSNLSLKITVKMKQDRSVDRDKFLIVVLPSADTRMTVEDFSTLWLKHKVEVKSFKLSCRKSFKKAESKELTFEHQFEMISNKLNQIQRQQEKIITFIRILFILLFAFFVLFFFDYFHLISSQNINEIYRNFFDSNKLQ